jgi:hypothetical protein
MGTRIVDAAACSAARSSSLTDIRPRGVQQAVSKRRQRLRLLGIDTEQWIRRPLAAQVLQSCTDISVLRRGHQQDDGKQDFPIQLTTQLLGIEAHAYGDLGMFDVGRLYQGSCCLFVGPFQGTSCESHSTLALRTEDGRHRSNHREHGRGGKFIEEYLSGDGIVAAIDDDEGVSQR